MIRHNWPLLIALAVLLAIAPFLVAAEPDPPFAKVVRDNRGGGSGTLVAVGDPDHTYVLTCKHVAPDPKHDYMVFSGPCGYLATWIAADDKADLALLRINAKLKWAQMPAVAPAAGAPVWTEGCPFGGDPVLKTGALGGGVRTTVDGVTRDWTTFSAPIRPGDSGAGVFSDGKLIGVAAAGPAPYLMVPFADIDRFLKAHEFPTATRPAPADVFTPAAPAAPLPVFVPAPSPAYLMPTYPRQQQCVT